MNVSVLKGKSELSGFRRAALLHRIHDALPQFNAATLESAAIFLVESTQPLTGETWQQVTALLDANQVIPPACHEGFFITPRRGTISPWSSKATDIFHNCGLNLVTRVEHGTSCLLRDAQGNAMPLAQLQPALRLLHDRMTEAVYTDLSDFFRHQAPAALRTVDILHGGIAALRAANATMGLALSESEIDYLYCAYIAIQRNPTDVELVMFGQVNSEHCRHKIFRAAWIIDGQQQDVALFDMIRHTHQCHPTDTILAYTDNSAVIAGFPGDWLAVAPHAPHHYQWQPAQMDILMKVETHNHPTAISPYPGAATGVGGEIRDEAATGIGGRTKAGLCAFFVSNLRIPEFRMPWELDYAEFPSRLATPLAIMTEGPLGGARFGNEFGRPQLCGIFRTYEHRYNGRYRGYHKPIMVAGGLGNIKRPHAAKRALPPGAHILQIGGPALRIGLGGGAASSMDSGTNKEHLDFDSVQRDNAEMQRRCQEVINACIALEHDNPILSIHDIGAGGLSNGCPELVAECGGRFWLRNIPNEEKAMSPMEIWCCEAQERYVLAIAPDSLDLFTALCARERCPVHVIGVASGDGHLTLQDTVFGNNPIDIDLQVILGKPPRMVRDVRRHPEQHPPLDLAGIGIADALQRVLRLPAVANKTFLITIADRSITGMVCRDQMVGPYQTPIADVAVTATSLRSYTGEAMAMGERTPVALLNPPASARLAIGEALTNIAAAEIGAIGRIKLSANWMCACGEEGEDAHLFDTVRAVGIELCPALGIAIPVGKDSLSMRTAWQTSRGDQETMVAPLSLVITAFAPVTDVRQTVTPHLKPAPNSTLLLLDLGRGQNRLGASALTQVYNQVGQTPPDIDDPQVLHRFFHAIQTLVHENLLLAYHDRSDGGLVVALAEMAFGARTGMEIQVPSAPSQLLPFLFAEELGAILQVADNDLPRLREILDHYQLTALTVALGRPATDQHLTFRSGTALVYRARIALLNRTWSELTHTMQARRDNPACAREEFDQLLDEQDPGMPWHLTFDPAPSPPIGGARPRVAIFREQGINGQVEMAAAFEQAGFESIDLHMTDLLGGRLTLSDFTGLVACGGFSYGDVLGAGAGWAKSILFNPRLKAMFTAFFARPDSFALGVCNGCQMLSHLKTIIPGAEDWPRFTRNKSEQFEARFVAVEILASPSILLRGMAGSQLGVPVAHGEGFADFELTGSLSHLTRDALAAIRYIDHRGHPTEQYPLNPNGSPGGLTGVTTRDGRVTLMMPHPERAFRGIQLSWQPKGMFADAGPWLRLFQNARAFVK